MVCCLCTVAEPCALRHDDVLFDSTVKCQMSLILVDKDKMEQQEQSSESGNKRGLVESGGNEKPKQKARPLVARGWKEWQDSGNSKTTSSSSNMTAVQHQTPKIVPPPPKAQQQTSNLPPSPPAPMPPLPPPPPPPPPPPQNTPGQPMRQEQVPAQQQPQHQTHPPCVASIPMPMFPPRPPLLSDVLPNQPPSRQQLQAGLWDSIQHGQQQPNVMQSPPTQPPMFPPAMPEHPAIWPLGLQQPLLQPQQAPMQAMPNMNMGNPLFMPRVATGNLPTQPLPMQPPQMPTMAMPMPLPVPQPMPGFEQMFLQQQQQQFLRRPPAREPRSIPTTKDASEGSMSRAARPTIAPQLRRAMRPVSCLEMNVFCMLCSCQCTRRIS